MAGFNAFAIAAEFRFDVAGALVDTEKLKGKVQELSDVSQDAMASLQGIGVRYAMQISGLYGGVFSVISKAISASEKFKSTQIEIANIVNQNPFLNPDGTKANYVDGLEAAERLIDRIQKKSIKLNIDADEWVESAKFFNAVLAPKGLAGKDMGNAMELSRVALKGVPALGIDMNNATNQIMNALTSGLSKGTMFSERLFAEAGDAIKKAFPKVDSIKEFNKLSKSDRLKALIAGLDKLAGSADAVDDRANLLTSKLMTLAKLFSGINSVLKPLGDVILPILKDLIDRAIVFIDTKGRELIKRFSGVLGEFVKSPEQIFTDLYSMSKMVDIVKVSANFVGLAVAIAHAGEAAEMLSKFKMFESAFGGMSKFWEGLKNVPLIGGLAKGLESVFSSIKKMFNIGKISSAGGLLVSVFSTLFKMVGLFGTLLIPITGLYRALAAAKIEKAKWLAENSTRFFEIFERLKIVFQRIMAPFNMMIKGWQNLFSMIVGGTRGLRLMTWALEKVVGMLEFLSYFITVPFGIIRGTIVAIFEFFTTMVLNLYTRIQNILNGNIWNSGIGTENKGANTIDAFVREFKDTINAFKYPNQNAEGEQDNAISNVTYNQQVTMNNSFKEVLSPDRIAFTIRDELQKKALFPSGGGGGMTSLMEGGAI